MRAIPAPRTAAAPSSTKATLRVMDILDRWSARYEKHSKQKRKFPRRELRTMIAVCISEESPGAGTSPPLGTEADGCVFRAWTRNLSRSGLSFLHAQKITQTSLLVGLPMKCLATRPLNSIIWFQAEVIRKREVHAGFWEYGLRFRQRATQRQSLEDGALDSGSEQE